MKNKVNYTQEEIQQLLLPLLKTRRTTYQKNKKIHARPGIKGEKIATITDDGLETENTVLDHTSYIVQNQTNALEEYIVLGKKFEQKYAYLKDTDTNYKVYQAKGKIKALKLTRKLWQMLNFPDKEFYFEPIWGGSMVVKLYDYLVCPLDFSEVYRVARKEFWETYKKV